MLIDLLEKRLQIIADHDLRENDPDEQLRQLQEVSEKLEESHQQLREKFSPRLRHFFEGCSYHKALDLLKSELSG